MRKDWGKTLVFGIFLS